ncbi:MAG TPA: exodeoxyribonuclease VII small subunit [Candidatus Onthomorpha intestinigallinarum]|uniref:Exodeoxyribonuclease VII small subunit n=1 Tax=Candidatus Onthomorpha intestinigallinarum TaxID=2840880 RepID=A0A9D1RFP1_9BACT|nr:exodeoxyribonuclease VII small subunit [Candidatus Onthomorpha intestinigallinarum]
MNETKEKSYTECFNELKSLVDSAAEGQVEIDELFDKVKRAKELILVCKDKLSRTEVDIELLTRQIEENQAEN